MTFRAKTNFASLYKALLQVITRKMITSDPNVDGRAMVLKYGTYSKNIYSL